MEELSELILEDNKIGDVAIQRTGDSEYLDSFGNLYLTGRTKSIINNNGTHIFSFQVECKLDIIPEIEFGTIIKVRYKICLVAQTSRIFDTASLKEKLSAIKIAYDKLIVMKKVTRDPRHNFKIDYEMLKTKITQ